MDQIRKFGEQTSRILEFILEGQEKDCLLPKTISSSHQNKFSYVIMTYIDVINGHMFELVWKGRGENVPQLFLSKI